MCRPDTCDGARHFVAQQQRQRHRSDSWWKKSLAIRTVAFVDAEVDTLLSSSRFLRQNQQEPESNRAMARFGRKEIELGELLGQGAFSEVYQVASFDVDLLSSSDDCEHDEESSLRSHLQQTAIEPATSVPSYVMKHLKSSLMENRTKFHEAAADLVLEVSGRFDEPA